MDTTEIEQRLNRLYNELIILETPWTNLVNKYNSLQSNPETANTEEAKQYHNEIISIKNKMEDIKNHIQQLESLFSEKPLEIKTDYTEKNAYIIRKAFEQRQNSENNPTVVKHISDGQKYTETIDGNIMNRHIVGYTQNTVECVSDGQKYTETIDGQIVEYEKCKDCGGIMNQTIVQNDELDSSPSRK